MSGDEVDVYGVLDVNDENEVLAPDWFTTDGDWLVVTPNSTHQAGASDLNVPRSNDIEEVGPFPISLSDWEGVGLAPPDREHLMRVKNEVKEKLPPDKILIEVNGERRFYRVPREDPLG
ncbi:hypothetical protein ACFQAS_01715 [Halopenitus salinus]|uniref:Uncharacterized protein n=1 Tax=Halopenitus salinus TaxID=1198295 RepID=A0ABD5UTX9_9EURY